MMPRRRSLLVAVAVVVAANKQEKDVAPQKHGEVIAAYVRERALHGREAAKCDWEPTPLVGPCPGVFDKPPPLGEISEAKTAEACEAACCRSAKCVSWQFRNVCEHGGDTRVGFEGDGPGAWCEKDPPKRWKGQKVSKETQGAVAQLQGMVDHAETREGLGACADATWNPDELQGQCFGLGAPQKNVASAAACRDRCCSLSHCAAWQWRDDKGCFAGALSHCAPLDIRGPFTGRRKRLPGRTYWPPALG